METRTTAVQNLRLFRRFNFDPYPFCEFSFRHPKPLCIQDGPRPAGASAGHGDPRCAAGRLRPRGPMALGALAAQRHQRPRHGRMDLGHQRLRPAVGGGAAGFPRLDPWFLVGWSFGSLVDFGSCIVWSLGCWVVGLFGSWFLHLLHLSYDPGVVAGCLGF